MCVSVVLLLTFLVYSSVSFVLFQGFACDKLDDGTNYLRAEYRIDCYPPEHQACQAWGAFMATIYPVGIPGFCSWLLLGHRDMSTNGEVRGGVSSLKSTSDLCEPYKSGRFYCEVIERALALCSRGLLLFVSTRIQWYRFR